MAEGFTEDWLKAHEGKRTARQTTPEPPKSAPQRVNGRQPTPRTPKRATGRLDPFLALLTAAGLPAPIMEYRFCQDRQFKADYAWPEQKVIVERQGGLWAKEQSRAKRAHTLPLAILRDYEKSNLAQLAGWTYLQFTPAQLDKGLVIDTLRIRLRASSHL